MQTIPCGRSQATKDSKVTWTKRDGSVATNNPRFTLDTATGGLIVNRAIRNDTGSYNCSVMRIEDGEFKVTTYEMFFNVQCMFVYLPFCYFNIWLNGNQWELTESLC